MKCWRQIPCGSLPADDTKLAFLAHASPETWRRVRQDALMGWYHCSDGRMYHPGVARIVNDVAQKWEAKVGAGRKAGLASGQARRVASGEGDPDGAKRRQRDRKRQADWRQRQREGQGAQSPALTFVSERTVVTPEGKIETKSFGADQVAELEPLAVRGALTPIVTSCVTPSVTRDVTPAVTRVTPALGVTADGGPASQDPDPPPVARSVSRANERSTDVEQSNVIKDKETKPHPRTSYEGGVQGRGNGIPPPQTPPGDGSGEEGARDPEDEPGTDQLALEPALEGRRPATRRDGLNSVVTPEGKTVRCYRCKGDRTEERFDLAFTMEDGQRLVLTAQQVRGLTAELRTLDPAHDIEQSLRRYAARSTHVPTLRPRTARGATKALSTWIARDVRRGDSQAIGSSWAAPAALARRYDPLAPDPDEQAQVAAWQAAEVKNSYPGADAIIQAWNDTALSTTGATPATRLPTCAPGAIAPGSDKDRYLARRWCGFRAACAAKGDRDPSSEAALARLQRYFAWIANSSIFAPGCAAARRRGMPDLIEAISHRFVSDAMTGRYEPARAGRQR